MKTNLTSDNLAPGGRETGGLHGGRPIVLRADDGYELGATVFSPLEPARGSVVIHAATATPQAYYARFARYLTRHGLRVVTYDYRGVGRSRPQLLGGFEATMTDWAKRDARAAQRYAASEWADPVALVGHSFGGQLLGLVDELRDAQGALLVGAQLGWYGHWPGRLERLRLRAIWKVAVPVLTAVYGFQPGSLGVGTDLPAGVAREWARWCSHPDYLMGDHPDARDRFARFDKPIVLYSFSDDEFAPSAAVEHLKQVLSRAPLEHRLVAPRALGVPSVGHFGFFRPAFERTLWREAREVLVALVEGRQPQALAARSAAEDPFAIDYEDVLADLEYGRA